MPPPPPIAINSPGYLGNAASAGYQIKSSANPTYQFGTEVVGEDQLGHLRPVPTTAQVFTTIDFDRHVFVTAVCEL